MESVYKEIPSTYAPTRSAWREWLRVNHKNLTSVWLIIYHKESGTPSVYYADAVEEALCFGWIDSKPNKRDESSYYLFFAKRKAKSNWSKVNRERIEKLIGQGLMAEEGLKMVELAKKSGTWSALDSVEALEIPEDMMVLLAQNPVASQNWHKFSPSTKKAILQWILNAKRPETRLNRITETVLQAEIGIKINHPGAKPLF